MGEGNKSFDKALRVSIPQAQAIVVDRETAGIGGGVKNPPDAKGRSDGSVVDRVIQGTCRLMVESRIIFLEYNPVGPADYSPCSQSMRRAAWKEGPRSYNYFGNKSQFATILINVKERGKYVK